ncbi:ParB/RepB/Spo0J family partition protein [Micromonospora rosaria]|uniref:FlsR2 n=2 Tax=Micromonospora rosaria TaxID=47874 RepID=A0A0P0I588_9ACTN|nr:ParB N-terminal domain-containing protein [Micromonospora rosaria]ALJ99870.1 FlsR2 [Micromonospora rosaria]
MTEYATTAPARTTPDGDGYPMDPIPDLDRYRTSTVPIAALVPGDSPRLDGIRPEHVRVLAATDVPLPPILVERGTMRVIDGMHRLHAALAAGRDSVEVVYFDGSARSVFVQAVKANIAHGLPLTLADRRAAARRIIGLYPEWSDRMVAATVGLSDKTVAAVRRAAGDVGQPEVRIGMDGRARPLSSAAGRWIASQLMEERPEASLREIAREAGISVATVRDVRARMRRGDDPVPAAAGGRRSTTRRAARPEAGAACPEPDGSALLEGLRQDPSLRYNEVGRELLRWLDLRTPRSRELEGVVERVPPHAALIVARVARRCAAGWERLAREMELSAADPADES